MTFSISKYTLAAFALSLGAIFFLTGAGSPESSTGIRWSMTQIAGSDSGAYILDQKTGDIYFLEKNPNIGTRKMKLTLLGNMSDAR